MRIKICNCIDNNPIREFDIDQSNLTILELLEHSLQRLNLQNLKDNVTVFSDGQEVPCDLWSVFKLSKTRCLKFVIKPQDFFSIAMIIKVRYQTARFFQYCNDNHCACRCGLYNVNAQKIKD